MKKIMFFEGDIETQGYFSNRIAEAMQEMGHQVFVYDLSKPWSSTEKFFRTFFEKGNSVNRRWYGSGFGSCNYGDRIGECGYSS